MVKVKALSHSQSSMTRETSREIQRVHRNPQPKLHPFQQAREYTRALNAAKIDRIFAKPFVAALSAHKDGVWTMAQHPNSLSTMLSGSVDGEVIVWNVPFHKDIWKLKCHSGIIRGLAVPSEGEGFLTCSDDKKIKYWNFEGLSDDNPMTIVSKKEDVEPENVWTSKSFFTAMDMQRSSSIFATAGVGVHVWDMERSEPVQEFVWGEDTVMTVRFNPVETRVFASGATDCSIMLYDLRNKTPLHKVILKGKTNSVAWNPMEAYHFTAANDNGNLYTFDMRNLKECHQIHFNHVGPVMDVSYSPTGKEFCSASWDSTTRIFEKDSARSREVYHTRRMQKLSCVRFSGDSKYILTGSDDSNIRVWKTNASEPLGIVNQRQQISLDYNKKLMEKYEDLPDIRKISKFRHVPKQIKHATDERLLQMKSKKHKQKTIERHSARGSIKYKPARAAEVLATVE